MKIKIGILSWPPCVLLMWQNIPSLIGDPLDSEFVGQRAARCLLLVPSCVCFQQAGDQLCEILSGPLK